ncbi:MAG: SDR family NAD(P)-dependent oxidoreductase [Muribaculaceae bacterium]|nr:SDR family NAD(P)-dependent oxidoreductase [Muribaculaceae bacterium]
MNNQVHKAVVVGASSGMGREVAQLLLKQGCHVGIAARREQNLRDIKQEYPENVITAVIDVTADDAPERLVELIGQLGGIDLYLHAAGIGKQNMSLKPDIEIDTARTNVIGFQRMVTAVFNYMAEHGGGHIAAITSIAGTKGLGAAPAYSATKAFQNTYIQALEQQAKMRKLNIHFTDIRPGFVDTALLDDGNRYPMLMNQQKVAKTMLRKIGRRRHVVVIDWRYRLLTAAWRRIPRSLWRNMKVKT